MKLHLPSSWRLPLLLALVALVVDAAARWADDHWQTSIDEARTAARQERVARAPWRARTPAASASSLDWPTTWPEEAQRDQRLAALVASARQHGLQVSRTDVSAEPSAPGLASWQVRMTAQGTYAGIRHWTEHTLASQPSIAMQRLRLSRAGPEAVNLGVDVEWALHTRLGEATP